MKKIMSILICLLLICGLGAAGYFVAKDVKAAGATPDKPIIQPEEPCHEGVKLSDENVAFMVEKGLIPSNLRCAHFSDFRYLEGNFAIFVQLTSLQPTGVELSLDCTFIEGESDRINMRVLGSISPGQLSYNSALASMKTNWKTLSPNYISSRWEGKALETSIDSTVLSSMVGFYEEPISGDKCQVVEITETQLITYGAIRHAKGFVKEKRLDTVDIEKMTKEGQVVYINTVSKYGNIAEWTYKSTNSLPMSTKYLSFDDVKYSKSTLPLLDEAPAEPTLNGVYATAFGSD